MDYSANYFRSFTATKKLKTKRVVRKCDVENCKRTSRGALGKCGKYGGGRRCEVAGCEKWHELNLRCAVSTAVDHGSKKIEARPSWGTGNKCQNTRARTSRSSTVQATRLQNHKLLGMLRAVDCDRRPVSLRSAVTSKSAPKRRLIPLKKKRNKGA